MLLAMWDLIARLVNTGGMVVNIPYWLTGTRGSLRGLLGAFPIAFLFMRGEHYLRRR